MLNMRAILMTLARKRPVFHSEADFQHALAWEIQTQHPEMNIRLEYRPPAPTIRMYVDIWATMADAVTAIELKYKTRRLTTVVDGEAFALLDQSAQDLGRYDFLKDVQRLEGIVAGQPNAVGYALLLTNDSAYWQTAGRDTVDVNFRLHHGRDLAGPLGWGANAGAGTMRGREAELLLRGPYRLVWDEYGIATPGSYGTFRYLLVEVGAG